MTHDIPNSTMHRRLRSNQMMKPTAPRRSKFSVLATTPCRGLSISRRCRKTLAFRYETSSNVRVRRAHPAINFMKQYFALLLLLLPALCANAADSKVWTPLEFLVGAWAGDGKAEGASGKGTTVFSWEVSHQLLVRRDHTEYVASADHPASVYEA